MIRIRYGVLFRGAVCGDVPGGEEAKRRLRLPHRFAPRNDNLLVSIIFGSVPVFCALYGNVI